MDSSFKTIFDTGRSSLVVSDLKSQEDFLKKCVDDAVPKLDKTPEIIVMGKVCHQNRNIGFFSDESAGYFYSGKMAGSKPLTENLKKLLELVNKLTDSDFNGILINEYSDGTNTIGKHSDDERNLGRNGVVSISFGAERKFRIREKIKDSNLLPEGGIDVPSTHCYLIWMKGDFQKEFTHEIPKEMKVKGSRISFTFRRHQK